MHLRTLRVLEVDMKTIRFAIKLCLVVATVTAATTGPTLLAQTASNSGQSKSVSIEVPAKRVWTPTGVILQAGQVVRVEASGTVDVTPAGDARPYYHQVPPEGRRGRFGTTQRYPLFPD